MRTLIGGVAYSAIGPYELTARQAIANAVTVHIVLKLNMLALRVVVARQLFYAKRAFEIRNSPARAFRKRIVASRQRIVRQLRYKAEL